MPNDLCCILSTYMKCEFCDKKICEECFKETQSIFTDPDNRWVGVGYPLYDRDAQAHRCNSLRCAQRAEQKLNEPDYYE